MFHDLESRIIFIFSARKKRQDEGAQESASFFLPLIGAEEENLFPVCHALVQLISEAFVYTLRIASASSERRAFD